MTVTIHGYVNVAYYAPPNETPIWFLTRERRDAALASLRDRAVQNGLSESASKAGIYTVKRDIDEDEDPLILAEAETNEEG